MLRLIFTLFLLVVAASFPLSAHATNPLYEINEINVDVTAENALAARAQAFEEAQVKAFNVLSERIVAEDKMNVIAPPAPSVLSRMVQDFEVTQEKISAVRYLGTYNFRFKESAVKQYLGMQGMKYTDVSSKPVLILPFFQGRKDTWLWSPENFWMQAWARTKDLRGLVPLIVPIGDLDDVSDIKDEELFDYNETALARMMDRYGAGEMVLAVGSADTEFMSIAGPDEAARGEFTVHIYRTDRKGPEYVSNVVVQAQAPETRAQMLARAATKAHGFLQKDWKQKTATDARQSSRLQVRVRFGSLKEWAKMQNALEDVSGVEDLAVQSLSPGMARVDLIFRGSESRLRLALEQADLVLSQPGINKDSWNKESWRSPVAPHRARSEGLVYDLSFASSRG